MCYMIKAIHRFMTPVSRLMLLFFLWQAKWHLDRYKWVHKSPAGSHMAYR